MSIPHTAYFYWGSKTKLTYLRYLSLATFRYHHPKWEIYLYQSDWNKLNLGWKFGEFQSFVRQHDYIKEAQSVLGVEVKTYEPGDERVYNMPPSNISDIFSYEILHKNGGWYSDMDSICVKNFDFISDQNYSFIGFGGLQPWIGIFGAVAGSWVMESFIKPCIDAFDAKSYNSTGTYGIRGMMTSQDWSNRFKAEDRGMKNWNAPLDMFYPLHVTETRKLWIGEWEHSRSNTWAVHLFGGNQDYQIYSMKMCPYWIRQGAHTDWITRYVRSLNNPHLFLLDTDWPLSISLDKDNKPIATLDFDNYITRPGTDEEYFDMTAKTIAEDMGKRKIDWRLKDEKADS